MIGCLRTRVRKQPIITLYFESENKLKFYSLKAWLQTPIQNGCALVSVLLFAASLNESIKDILHVTERVEPARTPLSASCGPSHA